MKVAGAAPSEQVAGLYNGATHEVMMKSRTAVLLLSLLFISSAFSLAQGAPAKASKPTPVVMEYYYKVKWGYQEEFLSLFKKNHLPFLREFTKTGEIISIKMDKPAEHGTEDGRWDYRVSITYRDFESAFGDKSGDDLILKKLFPDQATFVREEKQRFEILLAHWDVRMESVKLE